MIYTIIKMEPSHFILNIISDHFLNHPVKPEISFGNYFFIWDKNSLGIYSNEISDFKRFIKKMIPNLESMMRLINISINPKEKHGQLNKEILERGQFSIAFKHNSNIKFILYMDVNGSAIFYREEKILINNKRYNKKNEQHIQDHVERLNKTEDFKSVAVNWKLGDLLFNRSEMNKINQKHYSK
jgi:hypothetical protein